MGRNGKFNDQIYFKDYLMLSFIAFNGLNFILTSVAICPLIKFYCAKIKEIKKLEKNHNIPVSESRMGTRFPSSSDDDEFV